MTINSASIVHKVDESVHLTRKTYQLPL